MSFNVPTPTAPLIPSSANFSSAQIDSLRVNNIFGDYSPWKEPSRVSTISDTTLSGLQTVDLISLVEGDRVLVKSQTDASENGIYEARTTTWVRTNDLAIGSSAAGTATLVLEGSVGADTTFICTNDTGSDVVGTDDLVFSLMSSGGGSGAGGSPTDIQYNSAGVLAGSSDFTFTGTSVNLQVPLTLTTTTNTQIVTMQAAADDSADYVLTLPTDFGTVGQFLSTDGANPATLSWATGSGGSGSSLPINSVQYNSDGVGGFGGSASFTFDPSIVSIPTDLLPGVPLTSQGVVTIGDTVNSNPLAPPVYTSTISGLNSSAASDTMGGFAMFKGGNGDTTGPGGAVIVIAGTGGENANGGDVLIQSGYSGNTSGDAGSINIKGAEGISAGAGAINIIAGNANAGNNDGANVNIIGGIASGSGTDGIVQIETSGILSVFVDGGLTFDKGIATAVTYAGGASLNNRQGLIVVTNAPLAPSASVTLIVSNTHALTESLILVNVQRWGLAGEPTVEVIARTDATNFTIRVTNVDPVNSMPTGSDDLDIGYIIF